MGDARSWMYEKNLANGALNMKWVDGIKEFLNNSFINQEVVTLREGRDCIPCPCKKCANLYHYHRAEISRHLLLFGFCSNYTVWTKHGEGSNFVCEPSLPEEANLMEDMVRNAARPEFDWEPYNAEEPPNLKAKEFFGMLTSSEKPLWTVDCTGKEKIDSGNHTILSKVIRCLSLKAEHQMSQTCFDGMMEILRDVVPQNENVPSNFYNAKKLVQGLGMKYTKIPVCPNFCMLYYKDREFKDHCDVCKEPRYEPLKNPNQKKKVNRKLLRYLPITERLQRLYMTPSNTNHMRWHGEGKREKPGMMVHPADAEAWKHFDTIHPEFASEVRNVRLGLTTDGFTPYSSNAAPYSCWPVFVFPYNLPPGLLMKDETMFLSLLIPGPKHPGRDLDIFLEPLVDELKVLWAVGEETYDVSRKQNFTMKAALLWTVSDFPAYANLSGWGTKGGLACPYCMTDTKSFWLPNGGKTTWFDCHRCFLPKDHPFRRDKKNFVKGCVEHGDPPRMKTGEELFEEVTELDPIKWGKTAPIKQNQEYGVKHHWQKKSILWELTYWKTNLLRHCLDVMHLEKNFCENIIYMLFDIKRKNKDNAKARQDLELFCCRAKLHLTPYVKKPRAPYELTTKQRREVFTWLKEKVKFPDGYASNWSRCVNINNGTLTGLKSHDLHVFMERLLPVAFRDFVLDSVWEPLCEISSFFREICAKELDPARVNQLEKDVIVTLCKLEKQFPPGFFDSMEHLVIHVANEARLGGPVGPRWMYPCERKNKYAKMMVRNKARVEGSIVEATLIKEISRYCSAYIADHTANPGNDNPTIERLSIFDAVGRSVGQAKRRILSEEEYQAAHNYVIINCPEVQDYLKEFDDLILSTGGGSTQRSLDKARQKEFANWLAVKALADPNCDPLVRRLSLKPSKEFLTYHGYDVSGFRFHTQSHAEHRSTNNSGVWVKGETNGETEYDYYGILQDIVQLEYPGVANKVVLFKCHWFDIPNGVRIDKKHGLVEVKHTSTLRTGKPFVMACQSSQVYYLPYASDTRERRQWWVAMTTRRKGNLGVEVYDANADFFQEEQPNCAISPTLPGEDIDWDGLVLGNDDYQVVHPSELAKRTVAQAEIQEPEYNVEQEGDYIIAEESDDEIDLSELSGLPAM